MTMSLPYWQADTSRYPLITVHLVGAEGGQQPDIESLPRIAEGLIAKGEKVVVVYDLTGSKPDARRRQFLVTWLRKNRQELSRCVVASAIVAPTPFHRGVLVAMFWFIKPLRPVEVFGDRPAATQWAIVQGRRAGLDGLAK